MDNCLGKNGTRDHDDEEDEALVGRDLGEATEGV